MKHGKFKQLVAWFEIGNELRFEFHHLLNMISDTLCWFCASLGGSVRKM